MVGLWVVFGVCGFGYSLVYVGGFGLWPGVTVFLYIVSLLGKS